ncbi:MAG: Nramp family divalent metal transporter [Bacteroidota bacterium]|nr:Nramp family divalent metal transporter [Bacteroidota bacterium]
MESNVSLGEVHKSISIPHKNKGIIRRLVAFGGPAYLVSVGYMDPGNWATDLEGGAKFGYVLVWVLLMSNLMALLLQTLSARLGIVTGRDLAQACRDHYAKPVTIALWILCEIAIIACDLAEVLGTAIAINLLFDIPLLWGVFITALDVLVLLALQHLGMRKLEAVILTLILLIGFCFIFEIFLARPELPSVMSGFIPHLPSGSLVIAIGIIGATVMPHNLYLHSALVQTREFDQTADGKRDACKYNLIDSFLALNGAFFINAAILILAGAVFFTQGKVVTEIQQAHELLSPLLGTKMAGILFAVALLASGQSSTITGTIAGQIVMEGFLHWKIRPALRRIITRSLAIIPAALVLSIFGDESTLSLLIISQVVLSMQLAFAIIPLVHFTSERKLMGDFVNKLWVKVLAWITAAIVLALNINLLIEKESEAIASATPSHQLTGLIALPFLVAIGFLLLYILFKPWFRSTRAEKDIISAGSLGVLTPSMKYSRVGVAIEGNDKDKGVIEQALSLCASHGTIVLIHIVTSASGFFLRERARDAASRQGEKYLASLKQDLLSNHEIDIHTAIGFGSAPKELIRIGKLEQIDLLVMASHGHRGFKDLIFGTTVSPVRHALNIPVFIVQ